MLRRCCQFWWYGCLSSRPCICRKYQAMSLPEEWPTNSDSPVRRQHDSSIPWSLNLYRTFHDACLHGMWHCKCIHRQGQAQSHHSFESCWRRETSLYGTEWKLGGEERTISATGKVHVPVVLNIRTKWRRCTTVPHVLRKEWWEWVSITFTLQDLHS